MSAESLKQSVSRLTERRDNNLVRVENGVKPSFL